MAEPAGWEKEIEKYKLALCGESLLIEGVAASLRDIKGVEIVLVDATRPDAAQILEQLRPKMIVFDLGPFEISCVIAFLQLKTGVVLIGLDIERDQALVLPDDWRVVPTITDLSRFIEMQIQGKA